MNKDIIKELAEEAMVETNHEMGGKYFVFSKVKFAELIIRNCCEEIDSVSTGDYGHGEYDKGYDDGLRQAIITIKEYFGVKDE
jgi:hypothetical protein